MLRLSTVMRDPRLRKIALRIYQDDQMRSNESLARLSAVQKRKVIQKMFKALPPMDMERLTVRAVALRKQMDEQDLDLQTAVQDVQTRRKGPGPTAYELFVMEQCQNPAILAMSNPRDRETKMMEIYQSLPDKAKEVWEKKAERANAPPPMHIFKAVRSHLPRQRPVRKARPKAAKKQLKGKASAKKAAQPATSTLSSGASQKRKRQKKPRAPTGYVLFVKEQMALLTDLPQQERMVEIGKRWKALSQEERMRRGAAAAASSPGSLPDGERVQGSNDDAGVKDTLEPPVSVVTPETEETADTKATPLDTPHVEAEVVAAAQSVPPPPPSPDLSSSVAAPAAGEPATALPVKPETPSPPAEPASDSTHPTPMTNAATQSPLKKKKMKRRILIKRKGVTSPSSGRADAAAGKPAGETPLPA